MCYLFCCCWVSPMWAEVTLYLTLLCVCVSAQTHTQSWLLIGEERQSVYFSPLKCTEGWNHWSELVKLVLGDMDPQLISLTHSYLLACNQVNSAYWEEWLSFWEIKINIAYDPVTWAPWLHFYWSRDCEKTLSIHHLHPQGYHNNIQHCIDNSLKTRDH